MASIFAGHPLGMLPTSNPTTVNGIAYPVFSNGSFGYDNIAYANGGGIFDAAGLGMQVAGSDFNLYYAAGFGYLFTNNALSNQTPPYIPLSFSVAEVDGLVGLANGSCGVLAFQNGVTAFICERYTGHAEPAGGSGSTALAVQRRSLLLADGVHERPHVKAHLLIGVPEAGTHRAGTAGKAAAFPARRSGGTVQMIAAGLQVKGPWAKGAHRTGRQAGFAGTAGAGTAGGGLGGQLKPARQYQRATVRMP